MKTKLAEFIHQLETMCGGSPEARTFKYLALAKAQSLLAEEQAQEPTTPAGLHAEMHGCLLEWDKLGWLAGACFAEGVEVLSRYAPEAQKPSVGGLATPPVTESLAALAKKHGLRVKYRPGGEGLWTITIEKIETVFEDERLSFKDAEQAACIWLTSEDINAKGGYRLGRN